MSMLPWEVSKKILGAYARWPVRTTWLESRGEARSYGLVSEIMELVLLEKKTV